MSDIKDVHDLNASKEEQDDRVDRIEIMERLKKDYVQDYIKKFPFEKGQYHQCIPSPYVENEFITVMLVERSLTRAKDDD